MWILLIIAGIGYKPVNISQILLSETESQKEHIYLSDNDTVSATQHTPDLSWIITEPLGGAVGGYVGAFAGAIVLGTIGFGVDQVIFPEVLEYSIAPCCGIMGLIGAATGGLTGLSYGIYGIGKWLEKEDGSFKKTLLGSIIGGAVGLGIGGLVWLAIPEAGAFPIALFGFPSPLIGGVIGYRLSLPDKKQ